MSTKFTYAPEPFERVREVKGSVWFDVSANERYRHGSLSLPSPETAGSLCCGNPTAASFCSVAHLLAPYFVLILVLAFIYTIHNFRRIMKVFFIPPIRSVRAASVVPKRCPFSLGPSSPLKP
jgi:hypothetical protein